MVKTAVAPDTASSVYPPLLFLSTEVHASPWSHLARFRRRLARSSPFARLPASSPPLFVPPPSPAPPSAPQLTRTPTACSTMFHVPRPRHTGASDERHHSSACPPMGPTGTDHRRSHSTTGHARVAGWDPPHCRDIPHRTARTSPAPQGRVYGREYRNSPRPSVRGRCVTILPKPHRPVWHSLSIPI